MVSEADIDDTDSGFDSPEPQRRKPRRRLSAASATIRLLLVSESLLEKQSRHSVLLPRALAMQRIRLAMQHSQQSRQLDFNTQKL